MFSELETFFGYDIIESGILFINTDEYLKDLPKKDLYEHSIYQIISGSSVVSGEKHWTDFTQEEIDKDPKIKRFVEIDKRIEKFIHDEYENMLQKKYSELVEHFSYKLLVIIKDSFPTISDDELIEHKLYHMILLSTPRPERKTFLDFSQEEINKDPKIKRFVEVDMEIKKFIDDEYEKMQKELNEEEIANF